MAKLLDNAKMPVLAESSAHGSLESEVRQADAQPARVDTKPSAAQKYPALLPDSKIFPVYEVRSDGSCACPKRNCSSPGKHPRIRDWRREATDDPDVIRGWWNRWPEANIGLATGESGFVVIDIDPRNGGTETWATIVAAHGPELEDTTTTLTPSGGRHFIFRAPEGVPIRNSAGRLGPGFDVRANGGCIVLPPSTHVSGEYRWKPGYDPATKSPAPLPESLCALMQQHDRRPPQHAQAAGPGISDRVEATSSTRYGLGALRDEVRQLRQTPGGRRNDQLNRTAFKLSQLVAGGELKESDVREQLTKVARETGLDEEGIRDTLKSGLTAGKQQPRCAHSGPADPDDWKWWDGGRADLRWIARHSDSSANSTGRLMTDRSPCPSLPAFKSLSRFINPMSSEDLKSSIEVGLSLADCAQAAIDRLKRRAEGLEKPIVTPWRTLNEMLGGGLWPGFYVLVGNTGSGKTQLALQMALHAAEAGVPVVYVGLEMDDMSVVARLLGLMSGTPWSDLYLGKDPNVLAECLNNHQQRLHLPIHLVYDLPGNFDSTELRKLAIAVRQLYPNEPRGSRPVLVIVDYLQLVGGSQRELRERIGSAAYAARLLGRELDLSFLMLSSTSRENYIKVGHLVTEGDNKSASEFVGVGKESGEIEYASDGVFVLNGDPAVDPRMNLIIAKVRAKRPGFVYLEFDGTRFQQWEDPFAGGGFAPPTNNEPGGIDPADSELL